MAETSLRLSSFLRNELWIFGAAIRRDEWTEEVKIGVNDEKQPCRVS